MEAKSAINALQSANYQLQKAAENIKSSIRDNNSSIRRIVAKELDIDWTLIQLDVGSWTCDESPSGHCHYSHEDTLRDHCLICGMPEERK